MCPAKAWHGRTRLQRPFWIVQSWHGDETLSTIPGTATLAHVLRHRPTDAKQTPKRPSIELLRTDYTGNPQEVTTGYANRRSHQPRLVHGRKKCKSNIHIGIPSPATASLSSNPFFSPPRPTHSPFTWHPTETDRFNWPQQLLVRMYAISPGPCGAMSIDSQANG